MRANFNGSANNGIRLNNLEANDCAKWSKWRVTPNTENIDVQGFNSYVLLWDCDEDPWAEPVKRPADPFDEPPDDPKDAFAIPLCFRTREKEKKNT